MFLAVFKEFAHPEVLAQVEQGNICRVDRATEPCTLAKSEEELAVVSRNAKLFIDDETTSEEEVEATLEALCKLGFTVTNRHPVTSAGCPMRDRVILSYTA
ncbi:hypothetical protein TcYC6_0125170 [Trypanosoma cruzi]|uniref:Uncharacterized protein n=1 Tax=Trypanosoma cruzi (strain CL Brener) TaxID=353153 RepID=Q4DQL2_TRYCC|nr:hypothetical protein, conserved [Trypanosoma cruzi]EAN94806.1 hypothetical protein, conserved [Trypanosoma cruzi]KAF8291226.1 hypothetical protein TcYC6_0125170 [Trypanosoma cruzi]RNC55521.1 hypothetical protein TcCL_ESM06971 [Trypanosoma cruzi]|eukprot:XP_816657.1 hypothetical protein [Trypanosoma cruzi strain CL Brener]